MTGRRKKPILTEVERYELSKYAEMVLDGVSAVSLDAWDVKDLLGEKPFNEIQKHAEGIIGIIAEYLPE